MCARTVHTDFIWSNLVNTLCDIHSPPHLPRWFSIVIYLPFLFTVIVVLLNLLIAQMSDTYTKVQEDVESTFALERARIIAKALKRNILCYQVCITNYIGLCLWLYL